MKKRASVQPLMQQSKRVRRCCRNCRLVTTMRKATRCAIVGPPTYLFLPVYCDTKDTRSPVATQAKNCKNRLAGEQIQAQLAAGGRHASGEGFDGRPTYPLSPSGAWFFTLELKAAAHRQLRSSLQKMSVRTAMPVGRRWSMPAWHSWACVTPDSRHERRRFCPSSN